MPQSKSTQTMNLKRRDFLKLSATAAGAFAWPRLHQAAPTERPPADHCLLIHLVGGPSQIDTWDPKPLAPSHVRGPFRPIATQVPGLFVSELFPRLAARAHRIAWVRSLYHEEAPIHETGQQLLQTGFVSEPGPEFPNAAAVAGRLRFNRPGLPHHVVLPGPLENTGVHIGHGQSSGFLGSAWQPRFDDSAPFPGRESTALMDRYGRHTFGESCLKARQLIERGVPCVTVNMYTTVFDQPTWDCHADGLSLAANLEDYRQVVGPLFDQTFSTLLDDLHDRGLLERTLVMAAGEFGRTPIMNRRGGRDHWTGVWSMLCAGGGVQGGRVIGASDAWGGEPKEQPLHAARIAATQLHALGIKSDEWHRLIGSSAYASTQPEPIGDLF